VGVPVVLSGIAIGGLALYTSWHEIEEVYDAQLIHAAKVLRQLTEHELSEYADENESIDLIPEMEDLGYKYEQSVAFRIWQGDNPVTQSSNALPFDGLRAPAGLSTQHVRGEKWRFFVYVDTRSGITVETAERYEIRYELVRYLLLGLLIPASLFVPVVLLVVWLGTSHGLRPLARISRDIDNRDSNDLSSIEPEYTPLEIDALIRALNRLFIRLKNALDRERDFTDNAAHELRTPLAAIKMQAQALRKRGSGKSDDDESLANLLSAVQRASDLVNKLLGFSRLQKDQPVRALLDLPALVNKVVGELAGAAVARDQTLTFECLDQSVIRGDENALDIMLRNLVENSIKYTPAGGTISVTLKRISEGPAIQVEDNGPGIPDTEKQRVLQRFYRMTGSDGTGSGLGLAIAAWIAEQHQAELTLTDASPHGLICTVRFPRR